MPRRDRQHRLQGDVELAAESSATGRGNDPHALRRQAQHARDLVAIHHRRLRAGEHLHAIADAARVARFRLDVGVLDERGLEPPFRCVVRARSVAARAAAGDPDAAEELLGTVESADSRAYALRSLLAMRLAAGSEFASTLTAALGKEIEPEVVGQFRAGDIRACIGDPQRAAAQLDFRASVSFADGIRELLEWSGQAQAEDRVPRSLQELQRFSLVK